jgi:cellulose biosynthesis protein BcsQ
LTSISKGICLPPAGWTDPNELKLTVHRLMMDDEAEIGFFLLEPRPRLKLLPDTIDIEADDLLPAKKVNREPLLRRKLRQVLRDFDIIIIDSPLAMRTATLNGLPVAHTVVIPVDDSSHFVLLALNQLLQVVVVRDLAVGYRQIIGSRLRPSLFALLNTP